MDEFSWFVGLYEGEGCFDSQIKKKIVNEKEYKFANYRLYIKMTDEDIIARAAKFLGVSYHRTDVKYTEKMGRKPCWRVVKCGGSKGQLMDLVERMRPYVSKRRQEQFDAKILNIQNGSK